MGEAVMMKEVESEIRQRKVEKIKVPMSFKLKVPEEFDVSVKG